MDITLLYFEGCPNWKLMHERLAAIASERPDVTVTQQLVDSLDDAERLGFHGSPSMLVDGVDPFTTAGAAIGLACRVYQTPEGPSGAPSLEQVRAATAQA